LCSRGGDTHFAPLASATGEMDWIAQHAVSDQRLLGAGPPAWHGTLV
jgi:hypothetical protein